MTEEATPSMPTVVGTTRPRFEGVDPRPSNEVGFRRSLDETDDEAEADGLKPEPEALAHVASETPVAVEPEAETALVVADQGTQRKKILPHLEVDYSQYEGKFASYPRIDPNINLRSVQDEAVETYISEMETGSNRRVIVSLPTGCGKTIAGLSIAGRINGRVLWIAHRDELIEQPAKEIEQHFPGLEYGIEKASQKDGLAKRVVISSIQTLSRKNRLLRILQGAPFSVIIYDECHHATSVQAMRVLSWLGCFREDNKGPRLLGLTATIERSDKTSLGHVFQDLIYSLSIQEAIKLGFLVPPKSIKVYLPMRLKKGSDGDISISDAEREAKRLNVAQANATNIKLHCGERKTIVFTTSVDQAKRTAEACQRLGIKAEWVSGQPYMNRTDRKAAIKRFADGEIQVLACSDVLVEGYDERSIGAVVIARPTLSKSRWLQMAGRGLRTHAHKVDCLLIDIACSEHELVTADILLEPPEEKIKRKPRRREEAPLDSNTEWKRLQSYLRSARIDTIEHGEITFARASDDLIVTVAKDSQLVILRRVNPDGSDAWVIEHKGLVYTMEPLTLQEAMSVCDSLLPSFGGSAKPDSPEWEKATESPTPPPGLMPSAQFNETTQIVDPRAQLPLAMKFATGSDPTDLVDLLDNDIMNANSAAFARGLRLAFEKKMCHLLAVDKGIPPERHKWGWFVPDTKVTMPASPRDARGAMIGWVYGDTVFVEPSLSVKFAKEALESAGEKEVDIKTSYLRTHLGTSNRTFKDMRRDWIKVKTKDVEPIPEKAD